MRENLHGSRRTAVWLGLVLTVVSPAYAQHADRRVALTFDDLPRTLVGVDCESTARVVNEAILAGLARAGVRATGFVTGSRTCGLDPDRLRDPIPRRWLDAGHDLGRERGRRGRPRHRSREVLGREIPQILLLHANRR